MLLVGMLSHVDGRSAVLMVNRGPGNWEAGVGWNR